MKLAAVVGLIGTASVTSALSSCVLDCQTEAAETNCAVSNYNATSCYCNNGDFADDTKSCINSECVTDLGDWFNYRGSQCGAGASATGTATSTAAFSTATAVLTECILTCQDSAAKAATGCQAKDYNATSCYCSDQFAQDAVDCILDDCASDNDLFHNYRGAVCSATSDNDDNASETTTTAASGGSATSTSTSSSTASSAANHGLSGGAKAGISVGCIVGGLCLIALGAFFLMQRRKKALRQRGEAAVYNLRKVPSGSTQQSTARY